MRSIRANVHLVKYIRAGNLPAYRPDPEAGKLDMRPVPMVCPKCGRRATVGAMEVMRLTAERMVVECRECGGTMRRIMEKKRRRTSGKKK